MSVGGDKATTDSPGKSTGAPAGLAVEGVEGKLGSLGVVVVELEQMVMVVTVDPVKL